jgi:hypothetical protein
MTSLLRRARRQRPDAEEGSALILALLVVLLVGATLAAVLDFQKTGLTLTPQVRNDRNVSNYAQGAVEGAINAIRGSSDYGRPGGTCPDFTAPVPGGLDGVSGKTVKVTCSGLASPAGGVDDAPPYAIQAMGTASGEGISQIGSNLLYIDGGVYSAGIIDVKNTGQNGMRVNGSVDAGGACTGVISTTDSSGLHCNPAVVTASDPNYPAGVGTQAALDNLVSTGSDLDKFADPVPTCSGSTANFSPGYYETRPDDLLSKTLPSCNATILDFQEGQYYFDYAGTWIVKGQQLIGGNVVSGHSVSDPLGGACTSGTKGVQFVFAGTSSMATQSSSGSTVSGIELCGPAAPNQFGSTKQRIVVYGVSANNTSTTAETGPSGAQTAGATPTASPANSYVAPQQAATIDGTSATTVGTNPAFTEKKTASLVYALPSTSVPRGARVSSVTLRVAHTLVNATATVTLSTPRSATAVQVPIGSSTCTAAAPCTKDITSSLGNDVLWRAIDNLTMTYTATADKDTGSTVNLHSALVDGVDLQVTYTVPTFRRLSGAGTFFDSSTNPNVFMHGSVYTPSAAWSVSIHNSGESIFDRGILMRTITIDASSSSKQSTSPFQLPHGAPGGRYVAFRGYVDGTEKVRACVLYTDTAPMPGGATAAAYYGWGVGVPHWLYLRSADGRPLSC